MRPWAGFTASIVETVTNSGPWTRTNWSSFPVRVRRAQVLRRGLADEGEHVLRLGQNGRPVVVLDDHPEIRDRGGDSIARAHARGVVPASVRPGARRIDPAARPVPASVVVTVMNAGPDAFSNVTGFPSASVARSGRSRTSASMTFRSGIGRSSGGRFATPPPPRRPPSPVDPERDRVRDVESRALRRERREERPGERRGLRDLDRRRSGHGGDHDRSGAVGARRQARPEGSGGGRCRSWPARPNSRIPEPGS